MGSRFLKCHCNDGLAPIFSLDPVFGPRFSLSLPLHVVGDVLPAMLQGPHMIDHIPRTCAGCEAGCGTWVCPLECRPRRRAALNAPAGIPLTRFAVPASVVNRAGFRTGISARRRGDG
jgi:hypothetical protein